jgi:hypothetical protein
MQSKVIPIRKIDAISICGTLTQTTKMPCKSYSLPTEACQTGFRMAQIKGSICHSCYANKGLYKAYANTIKPAQFARLDAINDPLWVDGMVSLIGNDSYFRFHDSGDLQGVGHLHKIAQIADRLPECLFWLPTREYAMIKQYIDQFGALPKNLFVRLSAMYPDKPVVIPKSLQGFKNITASNVHTNKPIGKPCVAPKQGGACVDCRACWTNAVISYKLH